MGCCGDETVGCGPRAGTRSQPEFGLRLAVYTQAGGRGRTITVPQRSAHDARGGHVDPAFIHSNAGRTDAADRNRATIVAMRLLPSVTAPATARRAWMLTASLTALAIAILWQVFATVPQPAIAAGSFAVPRASVAEGSWSWPVAPPHPVTRPFDMSGPYEAGHRGIDLGVPAGAAVAAPADGVVRFAGVVVDRPVLSIEHGDGSVSSFEPVDPAVQQGDPVERGQIIGHVSKTISHDPNGGLHLGARIDDDYLNPLLLLGELPPSVLLPIASSLTPLPPPSTTHPRPLRFPR